MYYVSHLDNWELPCTQTVREMARPLGKNTQLVQRAWLRQSQGMCVNYIFIDIYWWDRSPPVIVILSLHFPLFSKHALPPIPGMGAQNRNYGAGGFPAADPDQHWLQLQHHAPISENESSALSFFPFHFCNLPEAQLFQKPAPLPVGYLH